MIYSKIQIEMLCDALEGNKSAFKRLMKEAPELAALESAIMGEKEPMEWLLKNNKMLAAFTTAIDGNKSAMKALFAKKEFAWAAVVSIIMKDQEAATWLERQGLYHFVELAKSIKLARERQNGISFI